MFPAARITDLHVCPLCMTPTLPPVPVPGPIIMPCAPNVLIGGLPAARQTDICMCGTPIPTPTDVIVTGAYTVLINFLPAARMSDLTAKGGLVITGCPNVLIGPMGFGIPSFALSLFDLFVQFLKAVVKKALEVIDDGVQLIRDGANWVIDTVASELRDFRDWLFKEREWYLGNDEIKFLHMKWNPNFVWDDDEISFSPSWQFNGLIIDGKSGAEAFEVFGVPFGVNSAVQLLKLNMEGNVGIGLEDGMPTGFTHSIKDASGKVANGQIEAYLGDEENHPEHLLGLDVGALTAAAADNVTVADGGSKDGVGAYGKAGASWAEGALYYEGNEDHGDGTSTGRRGKVGLGLGGGGSIGGMHYTDSATGQTHTGGEFGIIVGGGFNVSYEEVTGPKGSDGKNYTF